MGATDITQADSAAMEVKHKNNTFFNYDSQTICSEIWNQPFKNKFFEIL